MTPTCSTRSRGRALELVLRGEPVRRTARWVQRATRAYIESCSARSRRRISPSSARPPRGVRGRIPRLEPGRRLEEAFGKRKRSVAVRPEPGRGGEPDPGDGHPIECRTPRHPVRRTPGAGDAAADYLLLLCRHAPRETTRTDAERSTSRGFPVRRFDRVAGCVADAQVRIFPRDLLEQRQTPFVAQ